MLWFSDLDRGETLEIYTDLKVTSQLENALREIELPEIENCEIIADHCVIVLLKMKEGKKTIYIELNYEQQTIELFHHNPQECDLMN